MAKKGQTQPFKVLYRYPGQREHVIATGSFDDADRQAADIGGRGAAVRVVFRSQRQPGPDLVLAAYGPDVRHDITWKPLLDPPSWGCSCGAVQHDRYDLHEHLSRAGMETARWMVVRGESPGARAVEPAPLGIEVPDYVLEWAERNGLHVDDPDVYLMVTVAEESRAEIIGVVDALTGAVTQQEAELIREQLDEMDGGGLPQWARRAPR